MSNFLDQTSPRTKFYCYIEQVDLYHFETVQNTCSHVLSELKT